MKRALFALALVAAAAAGAHAGPDSRDALFRRGNDAYFHGHYREAAATYEQLSALGVSSEDLFYNLGNAYLKEGQVGPAIYNYERALELNPASDDAAYNLKAAHAAAKKKGEDRLVGAESTPLWMRAVAPFTLAGLTWVFFALYGMVFALLVGTHFVQPGFLRVGLRTALAFVCLGTLSSGLLLGGRLYLKDRIEQAIVLPDSAQVKEGPDPNYQSVFKVHAGLRVRITEKEQDWVRVRLANGLEGWMPERQLGRL